MNNTSMSNSARLRNSKAAPVFTKEKRQKFAQRENKKWIRLVTVLGYVVCVSLPAIALSIYYVYIWDPGYITKFPSKLNINDTIPVHRSPIVSNSGRMERNLDDDQTNSDNSTAQKVPQQAQQYVDHENTSPPNVKPLVRDAHLEQILAEGKASMESSAERFLKTAPEG